MESLSSSLMTVCYCYRSRFVLLSVSACITNSAHLYYE